jgi:hypothetical protein
MSENTQARILHRQQHVIRQTGLVLKTRAMFRSGTIQSNFFQWGKGIVEPGTHEQETVETDDLEVGLIEHTEESSHEPDNDPPRRHLI